MCFKFDTEKHLLRIAIETTSPGYSSLCELLTITVHLFKTVCLERKLYWVLKMKHQIPVRTHHILHYPFNLLMSSQFNFATVCHTFTFLSCLALDLGKSYFVQFCVQLWASKVFIKPPGLFWCRVRRDRWKAVRSHQGLIKNQLIFINFICLC